MSTRHRFLSISFGIFVFVVAFVFGYSFFASVEEPFATLQSPAGTYHVELYGHPERPYWSTSEVGSVVRKEGEIFWPYETLHTGDAMDISFELRWPNYRWVQDNILQLYSEEELSDPRRQKIAVVNDSDEVIPRLMIFCTDKFLVFDFQPESRLQLSCSPPKGDSEDVYVSAERNDGKQLEGSAVFDVKDSTDALNYTIHVAVDGTTLHPRAGRELERKREGNQK